MPDTLRFVRLGAGLLALAAAPAMAQNDLSVVAISAPRSGCALGAAENVTLRIFNDGSTLPAGTSFSAAYAIDAGAPRTELIVLGGSLLSKSTFTYTFTTPADLSVPGTYSFDASVALAGDVNPTNDALAGVVVTNSAPSVGGSVTGAPGPTLSGTLTLSGQTGNVIEWQQSIDNGLRWRRLSNTTTTQAFDRLREHTLFRAWVANGACTPAPSAAHQVLSSDPLFYAGFEP